MQLHYSIIDSPVGPLLIGKTGRGLAWLGFHRGKFPAGRFADAEWIPSDAALKSYVRELHEYFAGKRRQFDMPIDLHGTEVQVRCWHALRESPYGETITYAELSERVGSKNGFRAVGAANGANPVAIVVPCHRVVASDLTLGGYGGGLPAKEFLLKLEGCWPLKHVTASMF